MSYHPRGQVMRAGSRATTGSLSPMRTNEFDDPRFLARLRQGDAAAYRLLVRRFHASLVRFATSIIGSHAQAEEDVQDSWLAVCAGVGRFEERSSAPTWV